MTCKIDPQYIERTPHGQVIPHEAKIIWVDDGAAGVECCSEFIVLGEIDGPNRCSKCGCKLFIRTSARVMRLL